MGENHGHIFISYAHEDGAAYAQRLETDLTRLGYLVWRDKSRLNQNLNTGFDVEIEKAIRRATHVVICLTPSIQKRAESFVKREIQYAENIKKPRIPLKFPNAEVPLIVVHLNWIPFAEGEPPQEKLNYEVGFQNLLTIIQEQRSQRELPPVLQDPFKDYLQSLYEAIINYLDETVIYEIAVASKTAQHAVEVPPQRFANVLSAFYDRQGISQIEFSNFDQAFGHFKGRVLLLGAPGSGKTTTLMAFARDTVARRRFDPNNEPLPLLLSIPTWQPDRHSTILEWIQDVIPGFLSSDLPALADLMEKGKLLLILDGLDEIVGNEEAESVEIRNKLMNLLPENNQMVVSCRTQDYDALGVKFRLNGAILLQPLSDKQIHTYLQNMPDLWAMLAGDSELRELSRTPLILNLLTAGYKQARDEFVTNLEAIVPSMLQERIIGFYVSQRYKLLELRLGSLAFTLDDTHDILGQIAAQDMQKLHSVNLLAIDDFANVILTNRVQDFIAFGVQLGLLIKRGDDRFGFTHRLIEDYFYSTWVNHLDERSFILSYFEAFNWWGRYIAFPFCESLLAIWKTRHEQDRETIGWEIIQAFREAYPVGALAAKAHAGDWLAVRSALERLFDYFDVRDNLDFLLPDQRALCLATLEFQAESYRFADPPDFARAETVYHQIIQMAIGEDDQWTAAYQQCFLADLFVQMGQFEAALQMVDQAEHLARDYAYNDNEQDIKEILSLAMLVKVRAFCELQQFPAAGAAAAQAAFWAYAQLVDPGPPDAYMVQWYEDTCLELATAVLTLRIPDRQAMLDAIQSIWPTVTPVTTLESPTHIASTLFPANATIGDIGKTASDFVDHVNTQIEKFYALHPNLRIVDMANHSD